VAVLVSSVDRRRRASGLWYLRFWNQTCLGLMLLSMEHSLMSCFLCSELGSCKEQITGNRSKQGKKEVEEERQ
jgi:hypothetical protein